MATELDKALDRIALESPLMKALQGALQTEETGYDLVDICRNATTASMALAAVERAVIACRNDGETIPRALDKLFPES